MLEHFNGILYYYLISLLHGDHLKKRLSFNKPVLVY